MQNLALAKATAARIQDDPDSFEMGDWGRPLMVSLLGFGRVTRFRACLAGHTLLADGYRLTRHGTFVRGEEIVSGWEVAVTAKEALDLSTGEWLTVSHSSHPCTYRSECNLFCGGARNDDALSTFLRLIAEEEQRRLVAA